MPLPDYPRWPSRLHRGRDKDWLRISVTEGLQHFVPMQQIEVDLRQRNFTPAAISCPPNFSSAPLHSLSACTIEQPSILRPLPFPAPLSSNPTMIVGR